jgi:hypothetical protein
MSGARPSLATRDVGLTGTTRARARRRETRRPALEEHQKACQRWRKENTRRYALQT